MSVREQQVRALYRAALERPPPERASFVADLTGDDVELRRSVELLLSSHDATAAGERAAPAAPGAELAAGTVIAHYRIDSVIGRGGMGVVYRATDQKLHRPVAIKFLAAAVPDEHVRRRFEQEAKTTSGLNHPHIVTVLDVGEHQGQQYIVSELVDGGTLDDWQEGHRSRTWRQSVELVTGIADALATAHTAGVLHRDVKPGNILIGSNGYAKLADFGLAKLVRSEPAEPLKASRNTRAGLVIGTVAYMSPEQAAGETLDARSDVFSFGIVLYELLAGRRPFEAANELETLKSIAHAMPAALPQSIPEPLQALVDKALEKVPADRYQTMQDLVVDLKRLTRKQAGAQAAGSITAERRRMRTLSLVAGTLALALVAALVPAVSHWLEPAPTPARQIRFDIPVPGLAANGLAVAPNGERIAYVTLTEGVRRIWTRPLDSLVARPLPGTDNAQGPFWSPDSNRLAFIADGKLKAIDIAGGPATTVTDYIALIPLHGAWSEDGTIVYTMPHPEGGSLGLGRVPVGGSPTFVRTADVASGEVGLVAPHVLPGGQTVLYSAGSPANPLLTVYAAPLGGGDAVRLYSGDRANVDAGILPGVEYAAGFLLYRREQTLFAQRFDTRALELLGQPVPLAENVAEFGAAANLLVYRTAIMPQGNSEAPVQTRRLVWFDRAGQRLGDLESPPQYRLPVLSPDERSVAISVGAPPASDVWTIDAQRGVTTRVTFASGVDDVVAWSPDNARIAFNTDRDGVPGTPSSLYERAANGTGPETLLLQGRNDEILVPFDWSRDGRYLLFGRAGVATWQQRMDLWLLEMTAERTATAVIDSPFRKEMVKLSPDGRWIAYSSTEGGRPEIFVQPFPNVGGGKWQISTRGGREPRWRGDGNELFYLDAEGNVMAVDVGVEGEGLQLGQPQPLFKVGFTLPGPSDLPDYLYNVTADGQRFLVNEPVGMRLATTPVTGNADGAEIPVLHVIANWAEGLAGR